MLTFIVRDGFLFSRFLAWNVRRMGHCKKSWMFAVLVLRVVSANVDRVVDDDACVYCYGSRCCACCWSRFLF